MPPKFTPKEKENFIKRSLKGLGYWFIGNLMCFFVCTALIVMMKGILILKLFVSFCTAAITLGLYFNWAHYSAKRDKNAVKYHNMEYDRFMPLKMSLTAPIVSYVMLVMLYLCKLGVIDEGFFSLYILCDMWILPFITLFTGERVIGAVKWSGMFGITLITLMQPLVITLTYILTYNDVDVVSIVFYRKDQKK